MRILKIAQAEVIWKVWAYLRNGGFRRMPKTAAADLGYVIFG